MNAVTANHGELQCVSGLQYFDKLNNLLSMAKLYYPYNEVCRIKREIPINLKVHPKTL